MRLSRCSEGRDNAPTMHDDAGGDEALRAGRDWACAQIRLLAEVDGADV